MAQPSFEPSVDHVQVVAERLRAFTGWPAYEMEVDVPDDELTFPYYVVWGAPADPTLERMRGDGGEVTSVLQITAAALAALDVLGMADRARKGLHRYRPVIPGRRCDDITWEPGQRVVPRPDTTARAWPGRTVWTGPFFVRLDSTPRRAT